MEDEESQSKTPSVFLSSGKEFFNILQEHGEGYAIMVQPKDEEKIIPTPIPKEVNMFLSMFKNIINDGTPKTLSPKKDISHQIDFILGASLPLRNSFP